MTRWIIVLLTLIWAMPAPAETVRMRAGDFGDVTRLVLDFETAPDWQAGRTASGYALVFRQPGDLGFAIDSAFGTDDTRLLSGIETDAASGRVDLILDCDCWARIHAQQEKALIVDIMEGPPEEGAQHENPLPDKVPPGARVSEDAEHAGTGDSVLPLTIDGALEQDRVVIEFDHTASPAVDMLSRELSRAVSQGLIEGPDLSIPIAPLIAQDRESTGLGEGRSNLSIATSVDRAIGISRDQPPPTRAGSVCLPDSEVALTDWGDPTDRLELGRLRSEMFEEDGSVSQSGALAMARYYLTLGFGAEAHRLADLFEDETRRLLIQTLAEIVDHGESGNSLLDGQIFCDGKVALWSMLAHPVPISEKPARTSQILSAFSELPLHIRIHLGPVLSQRLRALGFEEEAQIALNAVTRGGGNTPAQDLTAARLGLSGTRAEAARGELQLLSRGTDLIAAEALLELFLDAERRGVPPEPDWVADAPSLVRATQGTRTAAELNLAGFRGRIALGDFDTLRAALEERSPGLTEATRRDLATAAIAAAGVMADDPMFLRAELGFSKIAAPESLSGEPAVVVAERLMSLGLPMRALAYIPANPLTDDEKRVTAAVLAELGRTGEAIAVLSDAATQELLNDLGAILLKDGRQSEAIAAFTRASRIEAASRAAILAGNWEWVIENADEPLSEASGVLRSAASPGAGTDAESSGNLGLLERAETLRRQAGVLLERTGFPETPPAFTN